MGGSDSAGGTLGRGSGEARTQPEHAPPSDGTRARAVPLTENVAFTRARQSRMRMPGPPTTQAILMTDLEGSTAHLHALGSEYAAALAQHHAIIHDALHAERGIEVGSEGDSFAAVLPGTAAGLRAAVAIQRELLGTEWPDSPWRVRIAIHAGLVEMAEAGAVGMSLHETARIRAAVHGGQIVVSEAARRAINEPVPVEIVMTDLGLHRLRDINSPLRLHQVSASGLPTEYPPLRTMTTRAIPRPRTPFIGRTAEVHDLLEALASARLVTITGAGGSGKTRLAFEVGRQAEFDAITVVELAGLRDPSQVAAELARMVGARQPDEIAAVIGASDLLLVIDNCEHVLPKIALLVSELLDQCEGLVVLATSREPLGVAGEVVWQVPQLEPGDAVELFSARAVGRGHDERLVQEACERLGRIPLTIELAAARVRSVPLDELVSRLDDQLGILTSGARDAPRQQTLRATLDWSHELLAGQERTVFRRLGVFAGGFTLNAAEALAVESSRVDVLEALDGLVLKSLIEFSPETGRYKMLEPVRQYAIEQLRTAEEHETMCERHLVWSSRTAAEAGRHLATAEQRRWTATLDSERENFGAAIRWGLGHDRIPPATTIVTSLGWYWFTSGRNDAFVWVPLMLAHLDALDMRDRAKALVAAGITYGDFVSDDRPTNWLLEAESIFRDLENDRGLGTALFWLGRVEANRDSFDSAERAFTDSLVVHERLDDWFGWG